MITVSEIFGPTIQGEGRHAGQLAVFLRLGGCNLHCWWCDTPYTWAFGRKGELHRSGQTFSRDVELVKMHRLEVVRDLRGLRGDMKPRLILTGGEPLLQRDELSYILPRLIDVFDGRVDVETAGTLFPFEHVEDADEVYYTVSPKLKSSGNGNSRHIPGVLSKFAGLAGEGRADFKFVISSEQDLEEVQLLQRTYAIGSDRIWLMPEGITPESILEGLQRVTPIALGLGYNVSSRLQTLIWGNKRGV